MITSRLWSASPPLRVQSADLKQAARMLAASTGNDKQKHDYRVAAWIPSSDGMYVAYRVPGWPLPEDAYLAKLSRSGEILWETPIRSAGVSHLTMTPSGEVAVWGERSRILVSGEGAVLAETPFGEKVRNHWTDGQGSHYVCAGDQYLLRRAGPTGLEPVPGLEDFAVLKAVAAPGGGLVLQGRGEMVRLGAGGRIEGRYPAPLPPDEPKVSYCIRNFRPLEGGQVLYEINQSIELRPVRPMHPGFGGGGFGIGGIDCFDPGSGAPEYLIQTCFTLADAAGAAVWKSETVGSEPRTLMLPDGTARAAGTLLSDQTTPILRVDSAGSREAFRVVGTPLEMVAGPLPGQLVIQHAGGVSLFSEEGRQLGRVELKAPRGGFRPAETGLDGRVLFTDSFSKELWAYDFEAGRWTALTEPDVDYSFRARRELPQLAPEAPGGSIEVQPDFVDVNGVRVRRKAGSGQP